MSEFLRLKSLSKDMYSIYKFDNAWCQYSINNILWPQYHEEETDKRWPQNAYIGKSKKTFPNNPWAIEKIMEIGK